MQIKFLKSIIEHLTNKQAASIVDLLAGKKDVNEFLIAKKLDLTINQTRNILYTLSDFGLVSFIRKKDKRKGWYIYFWTLNVFKSLALLEQKLGDELGQLKMHLRSREEKRYYVCKTCNIEVTEEVALLNNFVCSECEEVYELLDSKSIIDQLEKKINRIKRELAFVSDERKKEGGKLELKKSRKIKKDEDEKSKKRAESRKIAKKLRESIAKKDKKGKKIKVKKAVEKKKKNRKTKKKKSMISKKKSTNISKKSSLVKKKKGKK